MLIASTARRTVGNWLTLLSYARQKSPLLCSRQLMALCCLSLPLPLHFLGSNAKCTALLANANKEISANANANIKYLQMQMLRASGLWPVACGRRPAASGHEAMRP